MKLSLNWIKDYLPLDYNPEEIGDVLTDIGLEVEGMDEVESIKGGLEGIVVGEVKTCGPHPGADRLSLCTVDVGKEELLQIVCGAPNVSADQKVLVATIGTTLYSAEGEAWKIKKGKIRGEVSEGMICAEDELGLGNDHSGIIVLPGEVELGTLAKDYYKIENDIIYEIGLTPNRADATSHIGSAEDLAAAFQINKGLKEDVKKPSVDSFVEGEEAPYEIVVENFEACPRFSGVLIKGVTIGESPEWLKNRLTSIGIRPISNIVDITNYVLHETGQPLHAYDADMVLGNKIIVKTLPEGSPFLSLDEVERKLSDKDLMICDGEGNPMCIAGVFGGAKSGVSDTTKDIFLESAYFDAGWIRRTSFRHLLRSEAAMHFEKGADPNNNIYALKRAALLMKELAGGTIASKIVDIYPNKIEKAQIPATYKNIKTLIGVDIPVEKVKAILAALKIELTDETAESFIAHIPTNKPDVTRECDLIEEILRIYGFNNVPMPNKIHSTLSFATYPDKNLIRNRISDFLAANGFNEMMGLSLSQEKYYETLIPKDKSTLVYINNTSNVTFNVMRPDLLLGMLEAVRHNQNRQSMDLKLFEFGKSYEYSNPTEKEITEKEILTIAITGNRFDESWERGKAEVSFYSIKAIVEKVLEQIGIQKFQQSESQHEQFVYGLKFHRGANDLVEFGMIDKNLVDEFDIRNNVFFANFNWEAVVKASKNFKYVKEINKFPQSRRDLALVIDNGVKFEDIVKIAKATEKKILKQVDLFDVYINKEQLGADKKSYAVSFIFESEDKTLKDKDIEKVMSKCIDKFQSELGATIR